MAVPKKIELTVFSPTGVRVTEHGLLVRRYQVDSGTGGQRVLLFTSEAGQEFVFGLGKDWAYVIKTY